MKMKGWIYVITNKAMPGLVKIGSSNKDPNFRAEELKHTGSPHPYIVEYEMLTEEPFQIEQKLHKILSSRHRHEGKEWFRCSVEEAVLAIQENADTILYQKVITPSDKNRNLDSSPTSNTGTFDGTSVAQFKSVQGVKVICPNCETSYTVTLRRHETKSICPHCGSSHTVDIDW